MSAPKKSKATVNAKPAAKKRSATEASPAVLAFAIACITFVVAVDVYYLWQILKAT